MPAQLIVTDLDRTLLRTDKTFSTYTIDVLNRCREKGIKLAFATARKERDVARYVERLNAPPDALILRNGTQIYIAGELCVTQGISPQTRDTILRALVQNFPKATISVEINNTLYGNDKLFEKWHNAEAIRTDFTDLPNIAASIIIIGINSIEDIAQFEGYMPDDCYIEMSSGETQHFGFIMHRDATKWAGVQVLSAKMGIPIENIVAFGDDYNDVSMLQHVGTGIAVENAISEAKAVANFICDTNDNDGVARWLEEKLCS
ncbi:MAG: HAD family hydrolase [Defluviitaleaceae bacterium]|nr:HAD family hydrolase [Defluviitaleaceae bacterium]MCL2274841.1 HAD family hydrolase [Defluviitaleaceae bacterium]